MGITMRRVRIHGQQGKLDIVRLGDGPAGTMFIDIPDGKILEIAANLCPVSVLGDFSH
jgi:hypothetical protein